MTDRKKNGFTRIVAFVLTLCMVVSLVTVPTVSAAAVKLNKKKATITVGKTVTLKVAGTKKKVQWTSSKKSVATVSKKGVVTAKKAGKTTITAKVAGKKLTCKITVKDKTGKPGESNLKENNKYTSNKQQMLYVSTGKTFPVKFYQANGKPYKDSKVKLTSLNPQVASITAGNEVKGVTVGSTIVVATVSGKTYDIYVTVEKPIEYDFSGVTQTAWHKDWIEGVNWEQVDQHNGKSFTCKLLNTKQKVTWTGKVIAAHKPTNPVSSTDQIIKGSKNGLLSGTDSTNKIVFNGEGSDYITVEVLATTADGQKKKFYIFYNDKDGSSSIYTGPRWNDYITLEQYQKATYDAVKKVYPDAICIEEKDVKFFYKKNSTSECEDDVLKQEAFQRYDDTRVIPRDTGIYIERNDGQLGSTITGYLYAPVSMASYAGLSKDDRLKEIHDNGAVPVIYVTWFADDLLVKGVDKDNIEGCLFFDGTFSYGRYGEQIATMYYVITSAAK